MSPFVDFFQAQCDIFIRSTSLYFLNSSCVFDLEPSISWVEAFWEVILNSFLKVKSSRRDHYFFLNFILFNNGSGSFFSVVEVLDCSLEVIVPIGHNTSKWFLSRHVNNYTIWLREPNLNTITTKPDNIPPYNSWWKTIVPFIYWKPLKSDTLWYNINILARWDYIVNAFSWCIDILNWKWGICSDL